MMKRLEVFVTTRTLQISVEGRTDLLKNDTVSLLWIRGLPHQCEPSSDHKCSPVIHQQMATVAGHEREVIRH